LISPIGGHVRANGIRQHYLHYPGSGAPLVIVPGIVTPAILWDHVARSLAPEYDCYVHDVRGRGLSESGAPLDYGQHTCARDVAGFIRAKDLGTATLVGHSMGARIAVRAARDAPDIVRSLVLVDPPTSGPGRRPYPIPKARTLALLGAAHLGEASAAQRPPRWPEELHRLRIEWLPTCDERAVHAAYDDFHGQDMFADLAGTTSAVSLICAGQGDVVSDADVEEMRGIRPDLHAVRLQGAGHQLQVEDFAAFRKLLGEALQRHDARTAKDR
jgi:N-formylmaleamate deformylase